jgi:outer membrane immunogenic protein
VTPTLLAYESGGYTSARFGQVNGASVITGLPTFNESAQRYNGWFLGSGIEYAFTWLPIQGLFLKTEYRFSQYQTRNVPVFSAATGAAAGFDVLKPYTQTVTTELVYRFNWH